MCQHSIKTGMTAGHWNMAVTGSAARRVLARPMRIWPWLARHDPGYGALRRAGRTAIVMPVLFALGTGVFRNGDLATFAAFGSFSMLLFVDFNGSRWDRVQSQLGLAAGGAILVCLGTLASHPVWLAAIGMTVIAFAVLFVGSVSSVLASSSSAWLLAFILPVTLPGSIDSIPARLAGWGLAALVSLLAITVLWPSPRREPLREGAVRACHALAHRLRADVAVMLNGRDEGVVEDYERAVVVADDAVAVMHANFLSTTYRPTSLTTSTRSLVRLVDEMNWLQSVVSQSVRHDATPSAASQRAHRAACSVKMAAANVLDSGAALLEQPQLGPQPLEETLGELRRARSALEDDASMHPLTKRASASGSTDPVEELVSALDPGFRAQELSYGVEQVAGNIGLTAAAERRSWWERLLGRQPGNPVGTFEAAVQRAGAQAQRHSVWLHNSIRGAAALGAAVLAADLTGVQHSFWVVLGTLAVLRSNALSTGQNALRGILGTVVGVVVGVALLFLIGTNTAVLWILLPIAILVAGIAPTAISFAAGQAGFTVTIVLLFNIVAPSGWRVGLYRIEDIALGCGVSLIVGLLFWPRGAAAALRRALAEAYADSADYLAAAVSFGLARCDRAALAQEAPASESLRAAAASRRLDDTFRTYLTERGTKQIPLAQVTASVTGVATIRLAGDAIVDLWGSHSAAADGDRSAAGQELSSSARLLRDWYHELGQQLLGERELPTPSRGDSMTDGRLIAAVRHDLQDGSGNATPTAIRMIWTAEYLDAARRLQARIVEPVRLLEDDVTRARLRSQ
jgi:uncharacterized membrane protein YccC